MAKIINTATKQERDWVALEECLHTLEALFAPQHQEERRGWGEREKEKTVGSGGSKIYKIDEQSLG